MKRWISLVLAMLLLTLALAGCSTREEPAPTALGLDNELSRAVSDAFDELDETLNTVVGRTGATLFTADRKLQDLCREHGVNCVANIEF